MSSSSLRPLAIAERSLPTDEQGEMAAEASITTSPTSSVLPSRKTAKTGVACTACQTRRTKCTGTQPCQKCAEHGYTCQYRPGDDGRRKGFRARRKLAVEQQEELLRDMLEVLRDGDGKDAIELASRVKQVEYGPALGDAVRLLKEDVVDRSDSTGGRTSRRTSLAGNPPVIDATTRIPPRQQQQQLDVDMEVDSTGGRDMRSELAMARLPVSAAFQAPQGGHSTDPAMPRDFQEIQFPQHHFYQFENQSLSMLPPAHPSNQSSSSLIYPDSHAEYEQFTDPSTLNPPAQHLMQAVSSNPSSDQYTSKRTARNDALSYHGYRQGNPKRDFDPSANPPYGRRN